MKPRPQRKHRKGCTAAIMRAPHRGDRALAHGRIEVKPDERGESSDGEKHPVTLAEWSLRTRRGGSVHHGRAIAIPVAHHHREMILIL